MLGNVKANVSQFSVQETFKPMIEVLEDSDSSEDDDESTNIPAAKAPLQTVSPSSTSSPKKPLIEEVVSPPSSSLVEEVASPTPRTHSEDTVSLNEVHLVEAKHDKDSDDLLRDLGVMADSGYSKSGVIDMSKAGGEEPGAGTDVKKVQELMEVKGQGSEGGRETVKDDGLGDLD